MAGPLAVVLVSGGLDSCVAAAIALGRGEAAFLHLNYRQRTEARELEAFSAIADHYQVACRLVVDVSYLQQIGGSSLIDPSLPVPEGDAEGVPSTYVPFRNANLLGIGVAWAEVLEARGVYVGAHEQESLYPDCRASFFAAYNEMIAQGTRPGAGIRVETPLIGLDKGAIVRRGAALGAPLHLTWSCYRRGDRACGRCHSCRLRLEGFARAGIPDPIPYC
jgi:7-cyano-7-deazaguanine synthase